MEVPGPSLEDPLGCAGEAADVARILLSFFRLLAKVDGNETERGNDRAGD
jgi:hypothetical protein